MNYYLVFQNKSFHEELKGGYLWAPQKTSHGQKPHHWSDVGKVKKGDIIFNSYKGKMHSLIVAKENGKPHDRPSDLDDLNLWEKEGWLVEADYINLTNPLTYKDFMDDILKLQDKKYAPFNKIGRGNTGYLFRVSNELAKYLFELLEKTNRLSKEHFLVSDEEDFIASFEKSLEQDPSIDTTEKELLIKVRIGQGIFKQKLLQAETKCKICGVSNERLLIASHIKTWKDSNNLERLDVDNGLLLCPNHDALFDKGFISFKEDGSILISDEIDEVTQVLFNVIKSIKIIMSDKQKDYMAWHRKNKFN